MNYIVFEDFANNAVPVIFPRRISHEELREQIPYAKVISAGRIEYKDGAFRCYGESKPLGVKAAVGDGELISRLLSSSQDD